jgi:hypothetical protein
MRADAFVCPLLPLIAKSLLRFKKKNYDRTSRPGGIRRIFDTPPPRLLKIYSIDFFSSGAIIVFLFFNVREFTPFAR